MTPRCFLSIIGECARPATRFFMDEDGVSWGCCKEHRGALPEGATTKVSVDEFLLFNDVYNENIGDYVDSYKLHIIEQIQNA